MVDLAPSVPRDQWRLRIDALKERLVQDRLLFAIIAATFLFASYAATLFHRTYLEQVIEQYIDIWTFVGIIGFAIFFALSFASRAIRERPSRPAHLAANILRSIFRPEHAAGMLCYYALALFMGSFTTVKTILPASMVFGPIRGCRPSTESCISAMIPGAFFNRCSVITRSPAAWNSFTAPSG